MPKAAAKVRVHVKKGSTLAAQFERSLAIVRKVMQELDDKVRTAPRPRRSKEPR